MKIKKYLIYILILLSTPVFAQVEHVPAQHPVYLFLTRAETMGLLPLFSSTCLPLQRMEIINSLELIRKEQDKLSASDIKTLELFETEFEIKQRSNAVVIYSGSDSTQVFSMKMFGDDEKFIYHYKDSTNTVNIAPLASAEVFVEKSENGSRNAQFGTVGMKMYGSLGSHFGYYLQATNGRHIGGDKSLALLDEKYRQNIKFTELNSDMDFTESHIHFQTGWFHASIGRETRLLGSGLRQRVFISSASPGFDALSLGARFTNFEYRFTHASLLAQSTGPVDAGFNAEIPYKFAAIHRFALKPEWGEFAFWESIIYSDRFPDLAYLNPLSFYKSLEHALHDRDNSLMGIDFTYRIVNGFQLKGSFLLDDIVMERIGTGYWSNKTAWNIAASLALLGCFDFGLEYSRIEPYTYSHFNNLNSYTNDKKPIGANLLPNSDAVTAQLQYWYGGRYPLFLNCFYSRHGENVYDESGNLIKNVGGDPMLTRRSPDFETGRPADPENVTFLDGNLVETFGVEIGGGYEVMRGFNIQAIYQLANSGAGTVHFARIVFRFEDF